MLPFYNRNDGAVGEMDVASKKKGLTGDPVSPLCGRTPTG
jgi:hypothetical protein